MNIWKRVGAALSSPVTWLSPEGAVCKVCLKPRNGRRVNDPMLRMFDLKLLEQSLCGDCLGSVPWLRRIYCPVCGRGTHCEDCVRTKNRPYKYNRSAVQYDSGMKGWLARYKYRGDEQLSAILGEMLIPPFERLTDTVFRSLEHGNKGKARAHIPLRECWDAVIYVPISKERSEDRGFNQAKQMAGYIADKYKLPLYHLLSRELHTEKQSFKTRSERIKGTKGIFTLQRSELDRLTEEKGNKDSPLRILLVDDIYTTGSTVAACASTLHQNAATELEVYVLTWARS